jgi:hypothetical protein
MSKRKSRSTPNLPQSTLERVRQQLEQPAETPPAEPELPKAAPQSQAGLAAPKPARPSALRSERGTTSARAASRRASDAAQPRSQRKSDQPDMEFIRNRLAHPTRTVTEDQLRAAYGYVVQDLRRMGLLAAALVIMLVVIARFF